MTIYDPHAWADFLAEIPAIKQAGLEGDALHERIEAAMAPLLEGCCEKDGAQIYEEAMHRLASAGAIPADWAPAH
jgi:hypothetical protein